MSPDDTAAPLPPTPRCDGRKAVMTLKPDPWMNSQRPCWLRSAKPWLSLAMLAGQLVSFATQLIVAGLFGARREMDAYLAAFAMAGAYQLVTTDSAFKQFTGLDLLVLSNT